MLKSRIADFKYTIISLILAGVVLGLYFYVSGTAPQRQRAAELAAVEVREYEGENLSSVNDFRENSIAGVQQVDRESYRLKIKGLPSGEKEMIYQDVLNLPNYKKVVTLNCVEGWSATILWEGVLIKDLFGGEAVPPETKVVIFRSVDGYSTSLPIDYILNNDIIMAYKMNNIELPPERGFPFQVVAESKYGYKWAKWINEIELSADENFKGFWEQRGFSNTADINNDSLE
jgi:DMSO/TMAO reductase YedYZ molybdopterin-dependent catalytic subunit